MRAYSADLRARVVVAVEDGMARAEAAGVYAVSEPTITRWRRLKRETGGVAPRPASGAVATKTVGLADALPGRLAEHADATLAEHCAWWRERAGVAVSLSTMCRALAALGWTRKKRR